MIHHGECIDVLRTLPAESVDACVTDGPYGIGFMGREWDTFTPGTGRNRRLMHPREREAAKIESDNPNINGRWRSPALSPSQIDYDDSVAGLRRFQGWTAEWSAEMFRVLKPGAYLVSCGAPRSYHRMACGLEDGGFVIRDKFAWLFGSGFPKNHNLGDGKGTALKPVHEPIALALKPFKSTIKACHATHGTTALNIESCRIPGQTESVARAARGGFELSSGGVGRWPANVVIDEDAAAAIDAQSGLLVSGPNPSRRSSSKFGDIYESPFAGQDECDAARGIDVGGASRFYYCAKPSREERDFGCEHLTLRPRDESRKAGGSPAATTRANRGLQLRGNFHPTVKPVALMRWLVRLVTPVDGVVIDPFLGSGTTGMAARYERRRFIGIEREADYVVLAQARIAAVAPLFSEGVSA